MSPRTTKARWTMSKRACSLLRGVEPKSKTTRLRGYRNSPRSGRRSRYSLIPRWLAPTGRGCRWLEPPLTKRLSGGIPQSADGLKDLYSLRSLVTSLRALFVQTPNNYPGPCTAVFMKAEER